MLEDYNSLAWTKVPTNNYEDWLNDIVDYGITGIDGNRCNITVCKVPDCDSIMDEDITLGYQNCSCDLVAGLDEENNFFIYTVAYKDSNETKPNDIKMLGIFEQLPTDPDETLEVSEAHGILINSPVYPSIIPRFTNLQGLEYAMSKALTDFLNVETTVALRYSGGTASEPGSFLFGIQFTKEVGYHPSFNKTLPGFGDFAKLSVEESFLDISGTFTLGTEFGVIFEPDKTEKLKLLGSLSEDGCAKGFDGIFTFNITWTRSKTEGHIESGTTRVDVTDCASDDKNERVGNLRSALVNTDLKGDVQIKLIGGSSVVLLFDELYSFVEMRTRYGEEDNPWGIRNDTMKKSGFKFATGLTTINSRLEVSGSALILAEVGFVEVEADVEASIAGSLSLSAGKPGQLIPVNRWLSMMKNLMQSENAGFATAQIFFDGSFDASVTITEPVDFDAGHFNGWFETPFSLDLLGNTDGRAPEIAFDVSLPDFSGLKFTDIIDLLQKVLDFVIGPEESDTVESCSGGIFGKKFFGTKIFTKKIPIVGISACDFAIFLQVVVDTVDTLVNDCFKPDEIDAEEEEPEKSCDGTFQTLETKLRSLLQDGVGGKPAVQMKPSSDDTRSMLEIDLTLNWTFEEVKQLQIDLDEIFKGLNLDDDIALFAKGIVSFEGEATTEIGGSLSFTLGFGIEHIKSTGRKLPFVKGTTGLKVCFAVDTEMEFQATIGPFSANANVQFVADNYKDDLTLSVTLDENLNYYLPSVEAAFAREGFIVMETISKLVGAFDVSVAGRVSGSVHAELVGLAGDANANVSIADINNIFQQKPGAISVYYEVNFNLELGIPTFLDILLMEPEGVIKAIDDVFKQVEKASLGRSGIISRFSLPLVGNIIGRNLKAGGGGNFLQKARRTVVGTLEEKLKTYSDEGRDDSVADVIAAILNDLLEDILEDEGIVVTYYDHNETGLIDVPYKKGDKRIKSLMWTFNFGQKIAFRLPSLDFELGNKALPLQIEVDGANTPSFTIDWHFKLGVGFDEKEGFFLYTFPDEGESEFFIKADFAFDDPIESVDAKLLYFLKFELEEIDMQFGAGIFIDINKKEGLRLEQPEDPKSHTYGRLTRDMFAKVTSKRDLFQICATAAAGLTVESTNVALDLPIPGLEKVQDWIPSIKISESHTTNAIEAIVKKEVTIGSRSTARGRSLTVADRRRLENSISNQDHRGLRLLCEDLLDIDIKQCKVDGVRQFACAGIYDIKLDVGKIQDLASQVLGKVANGHDGAFDKVALPLVKLDERLPGISDIAGRKITVLDIAEIFVGKESGVDTVRLVLKIYRSIVELSNLFQAGGILLAERCEFRPGLKSRCEGGLADFAKDDGSRRQLQLAKEMEETFVTYDLSGHPISPAHRFMTEKCTPTFDPKEDCAGSCDGCERGRDTVKCEGRFLRCKANSIEGLSFPFMNNPASCLGLLSGKDIEIIEFHPPPLTFAFVQEFRVVIYGFPLVELVLGFEASVTVEYSMVLDSKGIREATKEKNPSKALNSFAFRDIIDGKDKPLVAFKFGVYAAVEFSAIIIKIGVSGGIEGIITVDFYDPFPETSGGLIRPFELLALGTTPLDWFELTFVLNLRLSLYVKIGIYLGFIKITFFKKQWTFVKPIVGPLKLTPKAFAPVAVLDAKSGVLTIKGGLGDVTCESKGGVIGAEAIQCWQTRRYPPIIRNFENVKSVAAPAPISYHFNCLLSEVDARGFARKITLNYEQCQLPSNEVQFGGERTVAVGVTKYFNDREAQLILPVTQDTALTTISSNYNSALTVIHHTDLLIKANELGSLCSIDAPGNINIDAVLTIDFGFESPTCYAGFKVVLDEGVVEVNGSNFLTFGPAFKSINLDMSNCNDEVHIKKTYGDTSSLFIRGGGGDDLIQIGADDSGFETRIFPDIIVEAGEGSNDRLVINDRGSNEAKFVEMGLAVVNGGFYGSQNPNRGITYSEVEAMDIFMGKNDDELRVNSTAEDFTLNVTAGDGNDVIKIFGLQGNATIYGNGGNDKLLVDGRGDGIGKNSMDGTSLNWHGGEGEDEVQMQFVSAGVTNLNLFGDNNGPNTVVLYSMSVASTILSRATFVANIHDPGNPTTSLERVNTDSETQSITSLLLYLLVGENSVHFDDTIATMDVFGGPEKDSFHIGQMFKSERNEIASGVSLDDPITTTLTTKGYLSDGCSHPVTINGGHGNDDFDVLRNKCILDLNGESGDDSFTVRSFASAIVEGNLSHSEIGRVNVFGDEDNDEVSIEQPGTEDAKAMGYEDPDYLINSLVDVDGGTGTNRLTIVGTEFGDLYVVNDGLIYGGGLSVKFVNIAYVDVAGLEGDDKIVVLSTNPSTVVSLYGGLGSDTFIVTPQEVEPVISKNLRGHRGIIEHEIVSDDPNYRGLKIRGIQADVLDNDGNFGYVSIVDQTDGFHLMEEDSNGFGSFSFWIFPTRVPTGIITVNVVSPAARDMNGYLLLNDNDVAAILEFPEGDMTPQEVTVKYNPNVQRLDITEINLMLKILVDVDGGNTNDERFIATEQSLLPVDIKLIPAMDNVAGAKSVTIDELPGGTVVAEGKFGFNTTYDIYLRPCSQELRDIIEVTMVESVPNQIILSHSKLDGDDFDSTSGCKATVSVSAYDDSNAEGDHFVTIQHFVRNKTNDTDITLTDDSPLLVGNVLVQIYDDDIGGVIIAETNGITATAEINNEDKGTVGNPSFYEDEYSIRLTKEPVGIVSINVNSIPVASDYPSAFTPTWRDYSKRKQVEVNGARAKTVVFNSANWTENVTIRVSAINDDIEEGVDYLNFASQPSNLGLIQGPIKISGADSPFIAKLSDPLMLPEETNPDEFIIPPGVIIDTTMYLVNEELQVDTIVINSLNVRGNLPSVGSLFFDQFVGMNMANDIFVMGKGPFSGISYNGIEVMIFNLGEGVDEITVENTSEAIHVMNMNAGDDYVAVKTLSGPLIVDGNKGNDMVVASSDEIKLDLIDALLAFDGGGDDGEDTLTMDNSLDDYLDDMVCVTRLTVEVPSMEAPELNMTTMRNLKNESNTTAMNPTLPRESYLVSLRDSLGGYFTLTINDPTTNRTASTPPIKFDANAEMIEGEINSLLIPNKNSCGEQSTSVCSVACKVWELGESRTFIIFFVGQRLNAGVTLYYGTHSLEGFAPEIYENLTNDILYRNSGVAYTNVDFLNIKMGHQDIVSNIRGTSAKTLVKTQEGNDKFFVGSDADENITTAASVDVIYGVLDYIEQDLLIESQSGRHRLLISDKFSALAKGGGSTGYAKLTRSSLENLADNLGNIYFTAENGNWHEGVNIWLGYGSDRLNITSIPAAPLNRTTTSVNAGNGRDVLSINLIDSENQGSLFIANGQGGNDELDASGSTLPVILFGDGGSDVLHGGSNEDVLLGDYGDIVWTGDDGQIVAKAGGGGYGDFTYGFERSIHQISAVYPDLPQANAAYTESDDLISRTDIILGNGGRDIIIGGGGDNDTLYGNDGSDFILGDFGELTFDVDAPNLYGIRYMISLNCSMEAGGGSNDIHGNGGDDILLGGGCSEDYLEGNAGNDVIAGDCVKVVFYEDYHLESIRSTSLEVGESDEIHGGGGDDIVIGGQDEDIIFGDSESDILLGDSGHILFYPLELERLKESSDPGYFWNVPQLIKTVGCAFSGNDEIYGGGGAVDYIIAGGLDDTVYGDGGSDLVFGDHGSILLYQEDPYKLKFATTTYSNCTRGADIIGLGAGNDIAFGGALGDTIQGGDGQDIILGDFGMYNAEIQFLPNQYFESITDDPLSAGPDMIDGGAGDDFLMGQEYNDTIEGGDGSDDILGGHHKRFGYDGSDTLSGGDGDDVILGDNGEIIRDVVSLEAEHPWMVHKWKKYAYPFETERIRDVRRYDDIDHVQGDDKIFGGSGNDILHGQRGNDEMHGEEGEDELFGELGEDTLYGGGGDDILIGDIGHAIRRYSGLEPISKSNGAWHKDIVLEELGTITAITRISEKIDVKMIPAETIAAASLLFVANAYNENGMKHLDSGTWVTDLIMFDLEKAHDDYLDGGDDNDVIIGQRGNDYINTGGGNDIAIGDGGRNTITPNMDFPRIYSMYRAMSSPTTEENGYAISSSDFGFVFTTDFDVYPNPHRFVDSQSSFVDKLIAYDDASSESNVLRDILGISGIETTKPYCMQPMLRVIPGFVSERDMLFGNDVITSENGDDVLVGDDILGFSAFDLTEFKEIQDTRKELDDLIVDLSVRISTLEYDTEHFAHYILNEAPQKDFNISIGCDNLTTSEGSSALVTGDILTIIGRTLLGSYLPNPINHVPQLLERIMDVQLALIDLHFALYEVHRDLLRRTQVTFVDYKDGQSPSHSLKLADDYICSRGNDTVVGDATVLYVQIDSAAAGYEFDAVNDNNLGKVLAGVLTHRQDELDLHIEKDLRVSEPFSSQEISALAFDDVPFYISCGNDRIDLYDNDVIVSGDFAVLGITYSQDGSSNDLRSLSKYTESIGILRMKPSVSSFLSRLEVYKINFFTERYDTVVRKDVEPTYHGDTFYARSSKNVVFGDFLSAATYGFADSNDIILDEKVNFYGTFENAEWAIFFSADTMNTPGESDSDKPNWKGQNKNSISSENPVWSGQKGNDIVNGKVLKSKTDLLVEKGLNRLFRQQAIAKQMLSDVFVYDTTNYPISEDVSLRLVCNGAEPGFSYVPSHTLSIYIPGVGPETTIVRRVVGSRQRHLRK